MTPQPSLDTRSVRQRVTGAVASVLGRVRPSYYEYTFVVTILLLALDFPGLPLGLIALLLFILVVCVAGKRIALQAFPRPAHRKGVLRQLATSIGKGAAALVLSVVVVVVLAVTLGWAHGPSGEERALEEALRARSKAGTERISMAEVLGVKDGTVCLAGYADKVGKDASWAQEAFSRSRSLFARDDYSVFQIAHLASSGRVRLWEVGVGAIPVASAGHVARAVPPLDLGQLLPQHCVPLASAVLVRAPWGTAGKGAYVLTNSAAPN